MKKSYLSLWIFSIALVLATPGCKFFQKESKRETIFDRVVSIPKKLILDVPHLPPLSDEITDFKKDYIDIKDGKLYYEEEGQGVPMVLISGGPGATHYGFHPYFSQIKDGARIIYYDQRGTGKSSQDDTGKTYTIKQAVEDLESLRKALNIDRWAVLGWSYGGLLAQCYALTYPNRCTGIILVASDTGLRNTKIIWNYGREKLFLSQAELDAIKNIQKIASEKLTQAQTIYNISLSGYWKRLFYYRPTQEKIIKQALYGKAPAPGFTKVMRQEMNKISLEGKFDDFEIPTLIIEAQWELLWNEADRAGLMRKNHPHAQIEIFEKAGHAVFADQPEKFFTMLKKFLKKSSKVKIAYKPGNRLTWPEPVSD